MDDVHAMEDSLAPILEESDEDAYPLVPKLEELDQPFEVEHVQFQLTRTKRAQVKKWREDFIRKHGNRRPRDVLKDDTSADPVFGELLLAYPQPAQLLWHFVETCRQIDRVLFYDSISLESSAAVWASCDLMTYLLNNDLLRHWHWRLDYFIGNTTGSQKDFSPSQLQGRYLGICGAAGIGPDDTARRRVGMYLLGDEFLSRALTVTGLRDAIPDGLLECTRDRMTVLENSLRLIHGGLHALGRLDPVSEDEGCRVGRFSVLDFDLT